MNWYYAEGTQQRGPVSDADFQQLVASGKVTDATLVWREGMAQWQPYGQVRGTAPAGAPTPPPPVAAPGTGFTPLNNDAGRQHALGRVNGPAIGLIATAVLGFVAAAGALAQALIGTSAIPLPPDFPSELRQLLQNMGGALGIFNAVLIAGLSLVILMGALKLRKLQSFGLAVAAAVIALVPCISPCCCVGLPVGIWALVVINSADVKPYFD